MSTYTLAPNQRPDGTIDPLVARAEKILADPRSEAGQSLHDLATAYLSVVRERNAWVETAAQTDRGGAPWLVTR